VGNVELGKMNEWVAFYENVMGFKLLLTFDDEDISTEYSALMSKEVSNGNGYIKFPINEPASGKKKSQIEEYLDFYHGAGCQHIAIEVKDILYTVGELRRRIGVEFLFVPDNYYDDVLDRVGAIEENIEDLKRLNILVDRDDTGYWLKSLPSRWKIDQPCFMKSFNVKGHVPLERKLLRPCLNLLKRAGSKRKPLVYKLFLVLSICLYPCRVKAY
jgi:4-hydroxyphenylpyruvate dioxygenase